jgi:hypothetical protein
VIKFITCKKGSDLFIVKLSIDNVNNVLRFIYEIYKVKDKSLHSSIEDSFKTNPESVSVFSEISSEKVFVQSLSQLECGEYLSKFNLDYSNLNNIRELVLPRLKLNLENYKIIIVHNFMKFFFEEYEKIKLNFSLSTNTKEKTETLVTNNKITISNIMSLIKNNLILYYVHNYLDSFYYNLEYNTFELNNKTLKLHMNNFIYDLSTTDSKNIYLLICNLNESDEEIKNTLNISFRTLIKIINNELLTSNTDNKISEETLIKINVLNILCLIYGVKFIFGTKISYEKLKYVSILNYVFLQLMKNQKNLEYDRIEIIESLNQSEGEINTHIDIEKISEKYKYLIKLSKEEFIKSILHDINESDNSNIDYNSKPSLNLQNPKILNISYLLELTEERPNNLINYTKIEIPNFIKANKIITDEYLQILYIINSSGFIDKSKLNLRITKFSDIIINDIFKIIDKDYSNLISTLIIMNTVINTAFKEKELVDEYSKLFILYKIVIPYLYDKYNIDKFIDYFL